MATYKSQYTGQQIDQAVGNALNKDTSTLSNDVNHIPASSVVKSALSTFVRPNLLDNWYFVGGGSQQGGGQFPINQRGQTVYSGSMYTIDRWRAWDDNTVVAVNDSYLTFTTGERSDGLFQYFQHNGQFRNKTITVSALVNGSLFTATGTATTTAWIAANIDESSSYLGFVMTSTEVSARIVLAANTSVTITTVKLELGDTQTLAHQENGVWVLNEIPNYQQELAKCQRYFQTFRTQSLRPTYGADFRPVMATATPSLGTLTIDGITYYTASSDL